jgi:hypothetical protein
MVIGRPGMEPEGSLEFRSWYDQMEALFQPRETTPLEAGIYAAQPFLILETRHWVRAHRKAVLSIS